MRKHRRFFLFPLASRKKDHRIMFYFLYRHLTLWSQFAKGTFCPLEALTDTSNIRQATIKTSKATTVQRMVVCYSCLLWFCTHTHKNINQKNIICPHTFFTNFTTPSVTVEAPNVQCQAWACQCVPEIKVCGKFYHRRFPMNFPTIP